MLLALIGTAYLTSTQTERYTANQNRDNVQADLELETLAAAAAKSVVADQDGTNPSAYVQHLNPNVDPATLGASPTPAGQRLLRYPSQQFQVPLPSGGVVGGPVASGYFAQQNSPYQPVTSATTSDYLGDRVPVVLPGTSTGNPGWQSISWHPFPDAAGNYVFENPFDGPVNLGPLSNKPYINYTPEAKLANGTVVPAFYINTTNPTGSTTLTLTGLPLPAAGIAPPPLYIGPGNTHISTRVLGSPTAKYLVTAASASGDGIADSLLFKMPGGPVNGVTYYAAMRIIDNNSAVNASTAWSAERDEVPVGTGGVGGRPVGYGMRRADVDLDGLLIHQTVPTLLFSHFDEMDMLNQYRFGGAAPNWVGVTPPTPSFPALQNPIPPGLLQIKPIDDYIQLGGSPSQAPVTRFTNRNDLAWYSAQDAMETLLAMRPYNPGYSAFPTVGPAVQMRWLGWDASAALAHKFTLFNTAVNPSPLEVALGNELLSNLTVAQHTYGSNVVTPVHTTPFAAGDANTWFYSQFFYSTNDMTGPTSGNPDMPRRALVTGENAVSNAIPSRLTNLVGDPGAAWVPNVYYRFGDWVTGRDGRSYVCLIPHTSVAHGGRAGARRTTRCPTCTTRPRPTRGSRRTRPASAPGAASRWPRRRRATVRSRRPGRACRSRRCRARCPSTRPRSTSCGSGTAR